MYTLLIVEDEPLIRAGLKQYYEWPELGFHKVVEAKDGKEGIEIALQESPDLIITDIRMPEMDGLEMIEQLRPRLPHAVFVILTGYNEFQYAQRALRAGGVVNYLLKPLQYNEGLEVIRQCLEKIEQQRILLQARSMLERKEQAIRKYLGSEAIKFLLEDDQQALMEMASAAELNRYANNQFVFLPCAAACIPDNTERLHHMQNWRTETERVLEKALQLLLKPAKCKIISYAANRKMYALAFWEKEELPLQWSAAQLSAVNRLLQQHNKHCGFKLYMALGRPEEQFLSLGHQLRRLDKSLNKRFFQNLHLFCEEGTGADAKHKKTRAVQLEERDIQAILACLEQGDASETKRLMARLAHTLAQGSFEHLYPYVQEIVGVTIRFARKHGIQLEGVFSNDFITLSFIDRFHSLERLFDWIGSWILHLNRVYQEEKKPDMDESKLFEQIEAYICKHIDQTVTLQMVADHFFYNPSYLSRLFKSKLNKNYKTFVNEIKIRYAKECLSDPRHLVSDVSAMCGFKSYKHFVKVFQQIAGVTPTEFRKQLRA